MLEIQLGKHRVPYTIRESNRAKYVNLRIDAADGLQIIVPVGHSVADPEALLKTRQDWILKHLRRMQTVAPAPQRQFVDGESLLFLGEPYQLEIIPTQKGKQTVIGRQAGLIRVRLRAGIQPGEQAGEVRAALENWYREQARHYIGERARLLAAQHGFTFEKITIKGQRTRWGSCSSKGNLNFNWRLMMTPPQAVDYVVIHELCHLKELNHSPRFWKLVATYCPDYKRWVTWLKQHNAECYL